MVLVVLGIDALDPSLVDEEEHPNLTLEANHTIDTIKSSKGEPSTHEIWPTIITGVDPSRHGLTLEDGVAWENPIYSIGSQLADYILPESIQTKIGAWLLTNTSQDAFRVPSTYYKENNLSTVFDQFEALPIGIPNYVVNPDVEDREHSLRRELGDLFQRDPGAKGGHSTDNPTDFYEACMEMSMIRIARARRGLRGGMYELVFAYTSGLDLIGHVSYDNPVLQEKAYSELNEFVGELRHDLHEEDELLIVSDHGLQDGVHTDYAMVASTSPGLISHIDGVLEVRSAIETELKNSDHKRDVVTHEFEDSSKGVEEQLKDLGYM